MVAETADFVVARKARCILFSKFFPNRDEYGEKNHRDRGIKKRVRQERGKQKKEKKEKKLEK